MDLSQLRVCDVSCIRYAMQRDWMICGLIFKELGLDAQRSGGFRHFFRIFPYRHAANVRFGVADIIALGQ